jgi:hypothetical protein
MEYLIVLIVIIAAAYINYGILPKLKERNRLKERNATQQIDNDYKQLYVEAKTAITSGDLKNGKEKILKSLYFPISPIDLSGCNDANSHIYSAKILNNMKRLEEACTHAETVFEELEKLYSINSSTVSISELRQQLSILLTNSKEAFEKQEQIVALNNKLAFSAVMANSENIKQREYEKKIKSKIVTNLKILDSCTETSINSKYNLQKLLEALPPF